MYLLTYLQAAARCLGSALLGPCGNRRAALISLRSGQRPRQWTP